MQKISENDGFPFDFAAKQHPSHQRQIVDLVLPIATLGLLIEFTIIHSTIQANGSLIQGTFESSKAQFELLGLDALLNDLFRQRTPLKLRPRQAQNSEIKDTYIDIPFYWAYLTEEVDFATSAYIKLQVVRQDTDHHFGQHPSEKGAFARHSAYNDHQRTTL